ncbi:hypothetical protein CCP3SC1AL1_1820003 [Gammaproteobacteria bacterium]
MTKKHYNKHMKGIRRTTGMLMTESVGYGTAGIVAGSITGPGAPAAMNAFTIGSSMAGIPSLVSGSSNVLGSLKMLNQTKHRKRKR